MMNAAALPANGSSLLQSLERLKQRFWSTHAHLGEAHCQKLWIQATSNSSSSNGLPTAQLAPDNSRPRTILYGSPFNTQSPTPDPNSMDRRRSAPIHSAVPMARSTTTQSVPENVYFNFQNQRSMSDLPTWSAPTEDLDSDYTYTSSGLDRQRLTLQPIAESSTYNNDVLLFSPEDYINYLQPSNALSPPHTLAQESSLDAQLTPSSQPSQSFDGSTAPSTPTTAGFMTPATRTSSCVGHQRTLLSGAPLVRTHSESSSLVHIFDEDTFPISYSTSDVLLKNVNNSSDVSPFFSPLTGAPSSESFFPLVPSSSAANAALGSLQHTSDLVEDMRRSTSNSTTSSDSDASSGSTLSVSTGGSRHSRRKEEIAQQALRPIAAKASKDNENPRPSAQTGKMVRMHSQDGSSKDVAIITKAPYVRPQHEKMKCTQCQPHKSFRGEHELRRHNERAHASVRKAYICIDNSIDKKFLANCKHCRNQKKYGAYYNAAAHLRRAHFNPRKRGRKGKNEERRGGIGGGDKPPMEILKAHWIKEIEVVNTPSTQQLSADSESEDVNMNDNGDYDYATACEATFPILTSNDTAASNNMPQYNGIMDDGVLVNNYDDAQFDASQWVTYPDNSGMQMHVSSNMNNFQFNPSQYMPTE